MLSWSIILLHHELLDDPLQRHRDLCAHCRSSSLAADVNVVGAFQSTLHCTELALYHTRYPPNHSATVAYDCSPHSQEHTASQIILSFAVDCCVRYFRHQISDIDLSLALRGPSPTILFTILRGQQSIFTSHL